MILSGVVYKMFRHSGGWRTFGISVALTCAGALAPLHAADGPVLFQSDFESGVLNDSDTSSQSQGWQRAGNMPSITTEQARSGKYAMKAYLSKSSAASQFRTMLQSAWNTTTDSKYRLTTIHTPYFQDSWVGFSIYLPSKGAGNWLKASTTYEVIAQWHDSHDPFPPPGWDTEESKNPLFALGVTTKQGTDQGREWRIGYLGDSRTPYPTLGSPRPWKYETNRGIKAGAIDADLDKWTDWVVHIRWNYWKVGSSGNRSPDENVTNFTNTPDSPTAGLIQVWKNGKLVVDEKNVQIGTHDNAGPVFSVGLYKGWRTAADRATDPDVSERTLYFDEFKYAGANGSYEAVAPGGSPGKLPPRGIPRPPTSVSLEAGK
jgi:hypothetical protein